MKLNTQKVFYTMKICNGTTVNIDGTTTRIYFLHKILYIELR